MFFHWKEPHSLLCTKGEPCFTTRTSGMRVTLKVVHKYWDRSNLTENSERNAFASELQTCQKLENHKMNSTLYLKFILWISIFWLVCSSHANAFCSEFSVRLLLSGTVDRRMVHVPFNASFDELDKWWVLDKLGHKWQTCEECKTLSLREFTLWFVLSQMQELLTLTFLSLFNFFCCNCSL